jgi:NSS family neurotransmitter:Na+ symporter
MKRTDHSGLDGGDHEEYLLGQGRMEADSFEVGAAPNLVDEKDERDEWGSNLSFLLAAIGAAVGLGNVVRFPYLTYKYGGAAFLVPYCLSLFLVGVPILALELMLGQRMRRGALQSFANVHPRVWGVAGLALCTAALSMCYYNVIMSWSWIYLYHSFSSPLPWGETLESSRTFQQVNVLGHGRDSLDPEDECYIPLSCGVGSFHTPVFLGLLVQWTVVFLCCFKGTKLVSKVVMVTMPLPFFMLVILLIFGLTLEGSGKGIEAFIVKFDWEILKDGDCWSAACSQVFFGLSLSSGGMIAYGSNQPTTAQVIRNTWIIASAELFFSLLSGFTVYAIIGHFAFLEGVEVTDLDDELNGYALSFVTFPVALAKMQGSNFWSGMFFFMILTLGIDSSMYSVETVVTVLKDYFPWCKKNGEITVFGACFTAFSFGLVLCTEEGEYLVSILDHYTATYGRVVVGLLECLIIGWHYDILEEGYLHVFTDPMNDDGVQGSSKTTRTWKEFLTTCRIGREIRLVTAEKAPIWDRVFPVMIKFITPLLVILLFIARMQGDVESGFRYQEFPFTFNLLFGWIIALGIPVSMLLIGLGLPMTRNNQEIARRQSSMAGAPLAPESTAQGW